MDYSKIPYKPDPELFDLGKRDWSRWLQKLSPEENEKWLEEEAEREEHFRKRDEELSKLEEEAARIDEELTVRMEAESDCECEPRARTEVDDQMEAGLIDIYGEPGDWQFNNEN